MLEKTPSYGPPCISKPDWPILREAETGQWTSTFVLPGIFDWISLRVQPSILTVNCGIVPHWTIPRRSNKLYENFFSGCPYGCAERHWQRYSEKSRGKNERADQIQSKWSKNLTLYSSPFEGLPAFDHLFFSCWKATERTPDFGLDKIKFWSSWFYFVQLIFLLRFIFKLIYS
jgi:hypothetical protein